MSLRNQKGFSLIELMIVVAIVGILSAVAIPNYQRFQNKAKQAEAKANLGGLFTAEKAFFAEYSVYATRFDDIGFMPEGQHNYNIGFGADYNHVGGNANAPTKGSTGCISTCPGGTRPTCSPVAGWNCNTISNSTVPNTVVASATTFSAQARSNLVSAGADVWAIDAARNLTNPTANY